MEINFSEIAPVDRYRLMIQSIVPRPIAWTLTENENGSYNLAPFSYFNAIHSHPPLVMMSVGNKKDKKVKDTRRNIERTKEFVVHIASVEHAELVTRSANSLPEGESEVDDCGLEVVNDWKGFSLPRLSIARIAFACKLDQVIEVGSNKQGLVFGQIQSLYVDDSIAQEEGDQLLIDAMKLNPLARLGGDDYGKLEKSFTVARQRYTPH